MSGYQVAQWIRRQPWGSSMVLVALTGWGQADDKRRAREAGFDVHLTKPVRPELLSKLLINERARGKASYREAFGPLLPGVRFCAWNDLSNAADAIGPQTAAVFVEPVQGEGGVRLAAEGFLRALAGLCRERGALLVADEVQCGLGRTGRLFAHQHAGITPDVLVLAKPLGGGLPLGAVLLREDLAPALRVGDHGSTFGGNPVACAAALAVLQRLTSEGFLARVERKGAALLRGLRGLARKHPHAVVEVRGLGLMAGVELAGAAKPLLAALRERGVLATRAGENVLRLLPPLVVTSADIREFLAALDAALEGFGVT